MSRSHALSLPINDTLPPLKKHLLCAEVWAESFACITSEPCNTAAGHDWPSWRGWSSHICVRVCAYVYVCCWIGVSVHMPELCKPNSWLLGDLRYRVNHTPGSWPKSLLAHASVPSWLKDDFFFNMDHFQSLYWICYNIASVFLLMFLFFGYQALGGLCSLTRDWTRTQSKVLTTGPSEKSLIDDWQAGIIPFCPFLLPLLPLLWNMFHCFQKWKPLSRVQLFATPWTI